MNQYDYKIVYNSSKYDNKSKISVILACLGDIEVIRESLEQTINSLKDIRENISFILVTDGVEYFKEPIFTDIISSFPKIMILSTFNQTNLPSLLFNIGLKYINTPYSIFAWPGSCVNNYIKQFSKGEISNDYELQCIVNSSSSSLPLEPNSSQSYGWCQCAKIYDLNNLIISTSAVRYIGGFDESYLLQQDFDWEWMLRLFKHFVINNVGYSTNNNLLNFSNYPFNKKLFFNRDIIHRYVNRNREIPYNKAQFEQTEKLFYRDIPIKDVKIIKETLIDKGLNTKKIKPGYIRKVKPYKITVIGGYWEYHHNQLCFFNYLDKLYGKSFATYKVLLDDISSIEDIKESDLVIISRSRNSRILEIVEECKKNKIATLYMLDDNWLTIAEDVPELYGKLFIPGNPNYDVFIETIKKCTAVITYNKYLKEDLDKYNSNVILFPINVDFNNSPNIEISKDKLVIGYTGSLRHDNTAFEALANVAKRYDVKVLLFGTISQEQKDMFNGIDTLIQKYVPYPIFKKLMLQIKPDILIAQLSYNRTFKSKCPNKYLEIGSIKAAGIYSNVYPYNQVVRDKINGLLVNNNTVEEWEEKIQMLLENHTLLNSIKNECYKDVKRSYSTKKHLKKFTRLIKSLIKV